MANKLDKRLIRTPRGDMRVSGSQMSDALAQVRNMGLEGKDANDMVINILLDMTSEKKAYGGAVNKKKKRRKKITSYNY